MSGSDSEDENFAPYGTPLDPYEEDEVPSKRKFQQPADQYAVDAHGRRRFHGAFTGGYSAGFGNTVGSQEGWSPATFKSSRSEKAVSSNQRPEDFMDEEDRSEYGIAPRQMQTHSDFSGQKRHHQAFHDGPIPGEPVLESLVRAVHETAAVRMLRSMGWRPGQGTGERLTIREKRKVKEQQKVYGCYMPPEMRQDDPEPQDSDSDSEFEYETLFAPDDYEPYILARKNDRFGLGYKGLSRHSVLGNLVGQYGEGSSKSHLVIKEKGKKVSIRGQAFGVGAFEAEDEDIYATEDMSHYDFTLGGPAKDKAKKKDKEKSNNVLAGFVRSVAPVPPVQGQPPPALPRDYTPLAAGARRSRFAPTTAPARDQGLGRHELTAEARGALLGEVPIQTNNNTDKQTPNEDLIAKITGRNVNFISTTDSQSASTNESSILSETSNKSTVQSASISSSIKIIDFTAKQTDTPDFISIKDSGKELTKVFKPFVANPAKQRRYEQYCLNRDSTLDRDGSIDRLTEWEREREMVEFEQAAKLYKPLTGIMGDRFTHASEPDDATNPLTAVTKSVTNHGLATSEQIAAAEKGMYGIMTRVESTWRPENIVCKRFNIPQPGVSRAEPPTNEKPKISYSIFSYLESSVHDKDSFAKEQTTFSGSKSISTDNTNINKSTDQNKTNDKSNDNTDKTDKEVAVPTKRMTVAELFLKESEKSKECEVTETMDQFDKMDLYKSIFLSDSEDSSDDNVESEKGHVINDFVEKPSNLQRNTSPPRGIFANIDFDEINSWKRSTNKNDSTKSTDKPTANDKEPNVSGDKSHNPSSTKGSDVKEMEVDSEVYGPKIPESLQKRLEANVNDIPKTEDIQEIGSSSSDSWVDAKEVKDNKKKKKSKNKKHKSKHKKSKHKKKDR